MLLRVRVLVFSCAGADAHAQSCFSLRSGGPHGVGGRNPSVAHSTRFAIDGLDGEGVRDGGGGSGSVEMRTADATTFLRHCSHLRTVSHARTGSLSSVYMARWCFGFGSVAEVAEVGSRGRVGMLVFWRHISRRIVVRY